MFDIHNMGYCGNFAVPDPRDLGLPDGAFFDTLFHDRQVCQCLRVYPGVCFHVFACLCVCVVRFGVRACAEVGCLRQI